MSFPIIVHKRDNCNIHIILDEYNGRKYLDVREFYMPDDSDEWIPTKRGIRLDASQFSRLMQTLESNKDVIGEFLKDPVAF